MLGRPGQPKDRLAPPYEQPISCCGDRVFLGALVTKDLHALEQGIRELICSSGAFSLSTTAGLTLSDASASCACFTSPAVPATTGQLAASGCPWQVRRCEARLRVPPTHLAACRADFVSHRVNWRCWRYWRRWHRWRHWRRWLWLLLLGPLQWRLCDLRLYSVVYFLEQT